MITKAGQSDVCRAGHRLQSQGRVAPVAALSLKAAAGRILSPSRDVPWSFLIRPSTDWARPTHVIKGHLLNSKSTDLNVNLI